MARKRVRISKRILFTWFILGSLIFLFAGESLTGDLQLLFAQILRWPLKIGRNVSLAARIQKPLNDVVTRTEYNKVRNHLTNLTEQLYQEHRRVEKLSGLRNRFSLEGAKLIPAEVVTADIDAFRAQLIINRGADDGLAAEQFVLSDNSVIGKISEVSARTSQVKLFTDPASGIAVTVAHLDIARVMEGAGSNKAKIHMIDIKQPVRAGDNIKVLARPGFLDAPVIIGRVRHCQRNDQNPSVWDIIVEPVCDIRNLTGVAVIIMNPKP